MKKLLAALCSFFGRALHKLAPRNAKNVNQQFSPNAIVQVETVIVASGPGYAFAYLDPDNANPDSRIFIPGSVRVVGGSWTDVRLGRRVRLGVVRDRHGRGFRALGLTFLFPAAA